MSLVSPRVRETVRGVVASCRIAAAIVIVASLLLAPPVWAHAFLAGASPPAGSQLPVAPAELTLRFTEAVEPLFCAIELRNAAGVVVTTGPLAGGAPRTLTVTLPKLAPGTYTVIWHAASVDTHKTEGRYQFTIGP